MSEQDHRFVFLRTEEEKLYYGSTRVREIRIIDVFVCEGCLHYERILIRTEPKE